MRKMDYWEKQLREKPGVLNGYRFGVCCLAEGSLVLIYTDFPSL